MCVCRSPGSNQDEVAYRGPNLTRPPRQLLKVAKQRLSSLRPRVAKNGRKPRSERPSPVRDPSFRYRSAFWRKRVFKGIFTRGGHRLAVRTWSVRIQFQGRRRTFSLGRITRAEAALRAAKIYESIRLQGWKKGGAAPFPDERLTTADSHGTDSESVSKADVRYWKARLLRRQHRGQDQVKPGHEFSTRIEYAGRSHYFPLPAADEESAAAKAAEIYQAIATEGWDIAGQRFARELTIGFHWVANPLAWTYTTIHTEARNLRQPTRDGNKNKERQQMSRSVDVDRRAPKRFGEMSRSPIR